MTNFERKPFNEDPEVDFFQEYDCKRYCGVAVAIDELEDFLV